MEKDEPATSRIGSVLRIKLNGSWLEATCDFDDGLVVEWETIDGRRGPMRSRLWDLNRRRQGAGSTERGTAEAGEGGGS